VAKIGVKLVVVLGHTDCGAVEGAVANAKGTYLTGLLRKLEDAIFDVSKKYNRGVRIKLDDPKTPEQQKNLDRVSFVNAHLVQSEIRFKPALRKPGVEVKWALYYLKSGKVAFDPTELEP
jgi:carbonic anhydrase